MHCFRPIDTVLPPLPLQATRVKVNSLPPPVLAAALASLAALHQAAGQRGRRRRQAAQDPMPPVDPQGDQKQQQLGPGSTLLPEEGLRELLGDLSVWSANKMMNFRCDRNPGRPHGHVLIVTPLISDGPLSSPPLLPLTPPFPSSPRPPPRLSPPLLFTPPPPLLCTVLLKQPSRCTLWPAWDTATPWLSPACATHSRIPSGTSSAE